MNHSDCLVTVKGGIIFVGIIASLVFLQWFSRYISRKRLVYRKEFDLYRKNKEESKTQRDINTSIVDGIIDRPSVAVSDEERRNLKALYREWQVKEKDLFEKHAKGKLLLLNRLYLHAEDQYSDHSFSPYVDLSKVESTHEIFMAGIFSDVLSRSDWEYAGVSRVRRKALSIGILLNITELSAHDFVLIIRFAPFQDDTAGQVIVMFDIYRKREEKRTIESN